MVGYTSPTFLAEAQLYAKREFEKAMEGYAVIQME
jgi:hypothetical protein